MLEEKSEDLTTSIHPLKNINKLMSYFNAGPMDREVERQILSKSHATYGGSGKHVLMFPLFDLFNLCMWLTEGQVSTSSIY